MVDLVTGATGFVGSAVVRALRRQGRDVRVLVRPESNRYNIQDQDVDIVTGDLNDQESIALAVRDIDRLFHVAADYRLWVPDKEAMLRTNVDATLSILRAATDAGVKRIVYTSSVATLGLKTDHSPSDEETPVAFSDMVGIYKQSKFRAEEAIRTLMHEQPIPCVIVNPSTPVGPGDIKPTPTGKLILSAIRGKMPAFVNTGLNIVHVDDVAEGHLLAADKGTVGQRYILGGENMTLKEILNRLAQIANTKPPILELTPGSVIPLAWIMERIASFTGREPFVTIDGVKLSRKYMFFKSDKAQTQLGYAPRPAIQALQDAASWFMHDWKKAKATPDNDR